MFFFVGGLPGQIAQTGAYLTTTELTQSVVDAVNDGAVFQSGG